MSEKKVFGRITNKHATEAVWKQHPDFVPNLAELIVYDKDSNYDYPRMKMGDGVTTVDKLPFIGTDLQVSSTQPGFACTWFRVIG